MLSLAAPSLLLVLDLLEEEIHVPGGEAPRQAQDEVGVLSLVICPEISGEVAVALHVREDL